MAKPLRLGVAGIGVVGASFVRLVQRQGEAFAARAGRECVIAAYSARSERDRGVDAREVVARDARKL